MNQWRTNHWYINYNLSIIEKFTHFQIRRVKWSTPIMNRIKATPKMITKIWNFSCSENDYDIYILLIISANVISYQKFKSLHLVYQNYLVLHFWDVFILYVFNCISQMVLYQITVEIAYFHGNIFNNPLKSHNCFFPFPQWQLNWSIFKTLIHEITIRRKTKM